LRDAGQIDGHPRLLIGQPEQWAAIADAENGVGADERGPRPPTIAEGASIAPPVRLTDTVAEILRSGGVAVAVSDDEIRSAVRALSAKGLYAEPTSPVAAAALDHFLADGTVSAEQATVVFVTGTGLKSADRMAAILDQPGS